ncbi:MAG: TetR/AcrR family transcriptional regulator [Rhodospirillales bacterium]|nr:TetR/AcrR family transcriptional regulator [Rhodospirillales bacterium]
MMQATSRARRKAARPGEISAAALALFTEQGFAATRMQDVAARAGIAKGTLYLYYPTKEELFFAVVREALLPRLAAIEVWVGAQTAPAPEVLRGLLAQARGMGRGGVAAIPRLVLSEAGRNRAIARFYAEEVVARGMRIVASILERGVARGEFRAVEPMAMAPVVFAPVLLGMLWRDTIGRHARGPLDPAAILAAHAENLLRGLTP